MEKKEHEFIELKSIPAIAFKTEKDWYIYDRYSNLILKTKKIIVDLIDDVLSGASLEDVHKKHKSVSFEDVVKVATEIDKIKQKDIFIDYEIKSLSICNDIDKKNFIQTKLNGFLTQLILNITEDCNLRCEYCIYSGLYPERRIHNNFNDMPWNIAKRAVDFFIFRSKLSEARYISFYGGGTLIKIRSYKKGYKLFKKNRA